MLAALTLLVGGVSAAYAASQSSDYTGYPLPTAVTTTATTTEATTRPTPTRRAGLAACTLSTSGCSATVVADSRKVWPTLTTTSNCRVRSGFFDSGIDRLTVWCTGASGANYGLIWRASSAGYPDVVDAYAGGIGADSDTFTLLGSDDVLGTWVRGPVTAGDGSEHYMCVWEYKSYPVAMVIDGADDGDTPQECSAAQFLSRSGMAGVFN